MDRKLDTKTDISYKIFFLIFRSYFAYMHFLILIVWDKPVSLEITAWEKDKIQSFIETSQTLFLREEE